MSSRDGYTHSLGATSQLTAESTRRTVLYYEFYREANMTGCYRVFTLQTGRDAIESRPPSSPAQCKYYVTTARLVGCLCHCSVNSH